MTIHFKIEKEVITGPDGEPYPDCLIIDRPDLKSMPLILGERILTVLFWGFWFYLWLPLISLLAWWFGFQFLYKEMIELGGLGGFIEQLHIFTSGVALVSGAIAVWSLYNLRRYGSYNRRNKILKTDREQLAADLKLKPEKLPKVQQAKRLVFSFYEDDSIKGIGVSPIHKIAPLPDNRTNT